MKTLIKNLSKAISAIINKNNFYFWFWKNAPQWVVRKYLKRNIKNMNVYELKKAEILANLKTKLADSKCPKHHIIYDYYNNKPVCPICSK